MKGCGKRFLMNYRGLEISVACGDTNFKDILPLCLECISKHDALQEEGVIKE